MTEMDNHQKHMIIWARFPTFCWPCIMLWFLVNDQRDAQFFTTNLFLFLTLYMFRAHRAHHQERQIVSTHPLVTVTLCRWPCRVQVGSELKYKNKYMIKNCASRWSFTKKYLGKCRCSLVIYLYFFDGIMNSVPLLVTLRYFIKTELTEVE